MLLSHALDLAAHDRLNSSNLQERESTRNSLPNSVKAASLSLLVTVCGQLREYDFRRILSSIWFSGLEDPDCRVVASVSRSFESLRSSNVASFHFVVVLPVHVVRRESTNPNKTTN